MSTSEILLAMESNTLRGVKALENVLITFGADCRLPVAKTACLPMPVIWLVPAKWSGGSA